LALPGLLKTECLNWQEPNNTSNIWFLPLQIFGFFTSEVGLQKLVVCLAFWLSERLGDEVKKAWKLSSMESLKG
jgi:hypothetical protein